MHARYFHILVHSSLTWLPNPPPHHIPFFNLVLNSSFFLVFLLPLFIVLSSFLLVFNKAVYLCCGYSSEKKKLLITSHFHLASCRTFSSYILHDFSFAFSPSFSSKQPSCNSHTQIQFLVHTAVPQFMPHFVPCCIAINWNSLC